MIELRETSFDDLSGLRSAYLASLAAPCDGMWEAFATLGRQLEIRSAGERAGFLALDEAGLILQFHLTEPFHRDAAELFAAVVDHESVEGAMVSTADPLFLGLCLDAHRSLKVHTYLYEDHRQVLPEHEGPASFEVVEAGELETIAELQRASLDEDPGDWLLGYLERLISRRELFALRRDGEVLGTGEARVSDSQPPVADLGVITMQGHRRRGVASHILGRLKKLCRERELVPICSTTVENRGAQKAIGRAGFTSRHRLLEIAF